MAPIQALTQLLANRQLQNAETATETILKDPESEEQTQTYTYIAGEPCKSPPSCQSVTEY